MLFLKSTIVKMFKANDDTAKMKKRKKTRNGMKHIKYVTVGKNAINLFS